MNEQERLWRTRLLLETLLDYMPSPGQSLKTQSGPAPSRYVPCGVCHGKRYVFVPGRGRRLCPRCDGQGERRHLRGEPYYDDYTGEQVSGEREHGPLRSMTSAELDASLARISRDQAERNGHIDAHDELPWLRKKTLMWSTGDYQCLLVALDSTGTTHPRETRAILHFLVHGWVTPTPRLEQDIERGVALVAALLPLEIRVPDWYLPDPDAEKTANWRGRTFRHVEKRGERNQLIRARVQAGESLSAVARSLHLSRRHVQRVVRDAA